MCPFICALFVHPSPAVCRPNDLITQLGGTNKSEHRTPSFTENKLIVHWDKVQVKVTRLTPGGPPEGRRNGPFNSHPRPPPLQTRIRGWGGKLEWNERRLLPDGLFQKNNKLNPLSVRHFSIPDDSSASISIKYLRRKQQI